MGGYGSGGYYRGNAKGKVEDCRSIDANNFSKWQYFKQGLRYGTLKWSRAGRKIGACEFYVNIDDMDDSIFFSYKCDDKIHPDVKINLSWYSPGFGGRRYFFLCPLCGRRMRTLHFRFGEIACRICHNLTYESCVENNHFNSLYKLMAVGSNASWQDFKRNINYLTRAGSKEPKRPRGRPRNAKLS